MIAVLSCVMLLFLTASAQSGEPVQPVGFKHARITDAVASLVQERLVRALAYNPGKRVVGLGGRYH